VDILLRIVNKLPMPTSVRLAWKRSLLDRSYARDLAAAKKQSDPKKIEEIEQEWRLDIDLHTEDEDFYLSRQLRAQARHLRLPIPQIYNKDNSVSEHWQQTRHAGHWCLTTTAVQALREAIRGEIKARHELRAHWAVWLSALTGVIGAITGLVAVLASKSP
jgi:hypothetical protein